MPALAATVSAWTQQLQQAIQSARDTNNLVTQAQRSQQNLRQTLQSNQADMLQADKNLACHGACGAKAVVAADRERLQSLLEHKRIECLALQAEQDQTRTLECQIQRLMLKCNEQSEAFTNSTAEAEQEHMPCLERADAVRKALCTGLNAQMASCKQQVDTLAQKQVVMKKSHARLALQAHFLDEQLNAHEQVCCLPLLLPLVCMAFETGGPERCLPASMQLSK